jgi:hypothetical protein
LMVLLEKNKTNKFGQTKLAVVHLIVQCLQQLTYFD